LKYLSLVRLVALVVNFTYVCVETEITNTQK
jgi:hypothetical protein